MEGTLTSMGEILQQHTSRWANAHIMLENLKHLASPSIFVGGQAFLRGLHNKQPPQMASLLLHMLAHLPSELGDRIAKLRSLVEEVKSSFVVVVPAYYWDKGEKTFKRMPEAGELASRKCMSMVHWYQLMTNLGQPVMPQLPQIQEWKEIVQDGIIHNSFGPDLNHPQE
jgi:hypothetical protein